MCMIKINFQTWLVIKLIKRQFLIILYMVVPENGRKPTHKKRLKMYLERNTSMQSKHF